MAISTYATSELYKQFKSWVAKQTLDTGDGDKVWRYYDFGPKDVPPLVCLPGASGTAEIFYRQFLTLCPRGYRVIAVQYAPYFTHDSWCKGFDRFLDALHLREVHLFGTALGGYLAQCYIQFRPKRVVSLVLQNSFCDTSYYVQNAPCAPMFSVTPKFMLQRMILKNFPQGELEVEIANSVDFMVEQLETLSQAELASRLTLNCTPGLLRVADFPMPSDKITIIDCLDEVAIPEKLREEVYKYYPEAKIAYLKTGGNFPYLSRADEFNVYLQVHLRAHGLAVNLPALAPNDSEPNTAVASSAAASASATEEEEEEVERNE